MTSPPLPLSFTQKRLYFIDRFETPRSLYNIAHAFEIHGALDDAALRRAFDLIVARHSVLRTNFLDDQGEPVQVIRPIGAADLRVHDLSGASFSAEEIHDQLRAEAERSFDLERDPLLRAALFKMGGRQFLVLTMHHIVSDGWSMGILYRELATAYGLLASGHTANFPSLPMQFADYAVWQRNELDGGRMAALLDYWQTALSDSPAVLELPTDRKRPAQQSYRGASIAFSLPTDLTAALKVLSRREQVTMFMVLLTGFKVMLYRYSGQTDLCVGTPIAGRTNVQTEDLIGFFANTLVLRTQLSAEMSFRELLQRVRQTSLGAFARQDMPFDRLVEVLRPPRSLAHHPLFQVALAFQNTPEGRLQLPGVVIEPIVMPSTTSKFDLSLSLHEERSRIAGICEFNTDLFDRPTVEGMCHHYELLLRGAVEQPNRSLTTLPMLDASERSKVVVEWNRTASPFPRDAAIPALFDAQVAASPDAVAVVDSDGEITFRELNARTNKLARYLRTRGVAAGAVVGVAAERSIEAVIGLLAVLKSGAAYLPLDPSYPDERIAFMIDDAGVSFVLTSSDRRARRWGNAETVALDGESAEWLRQTSDASLDIRCHADDLAYVMYTSGSTGLPKGVAVSHRAIVRLVINTDYVRFQSTDSIGHLSNLSFDAATFEIWGALLNGARLIVIRKDDVLVPQTFARVLERHRVTVMFITAALFNQIAQHAPQSFRFVRDLLIGGEAPDPHWVAEVMRAGRPQRILNAYGPTETTTFACCYQVPDSIDGSLASLPIGSPIANTRAFVVDAVLQPVPIGVPGELLIGGDGVAQGYYRRPELTREKFIADPFSEDTGARLYRTGDRARFRRDGAIEFLGRTDRQVKLRGYRIELGEVEATAKRHAGVDDAVVMLIESDTDKRLVAYIQVGAGSVSAEEIKAYLERWLPAYAIPAEILLLERFPLTLNGKIDRETLRSHAPSAVTVAAPVPPRDAVERALLEIWQSTLAVRGIGVTDNFFDVGGHSLAAMRVFSRIAAEFGKELPIALLFESPTIAGLADKLRQQLRDDGDSCVVEIQRGAAQVPVFFVHGIGGNVVGFRELARLLGPDRPVFGLQANGHADPIQIEVEEIAARYAKEIRAKWPSGPYALAGFSFGGVVAFEIARRITADGGDVALLAFLDAPALGANRLLPKPTRLRRLVQSVSRRAAMQVTNLRRLEMKEWGGYLARRWRTARSRVHYASWRMQFRVYSRLYPESSASVCHCHVDVPPRFRDVTGRLTLAARNYTPRPYDGDATLFHARNAPATLRPDPTMGWAGLVRSLDVRWVPGQHETLLSAPNVGVLAAELRRLLRKIDAPPSPYTDQTRRVELVHSYGS